MKSLKKSRKFTATVLLSLSMLMGMIPTELYAEVSTEETVVEETTDLLHEYDIDNTGDNRSWRFNSFNWEENFDPVTGRYQDLYVEGFSCGEHSDGVTAEGEGPHTITISNNIIPGGFYVVNVQTDYFRSEFKVSGDINGEDYYYTPKKSCWAIVNVQTVSDNIVISAKTGSIFRQIDLLKAETHTVHFMKDEETEYEALEMTVHDDTMINRKKLSESMEKARENGSFVSSDPEKTVFVGWSETPGGEKSDLKSDTIREDTWLYALWEKPVLTEGLFFEVTDPKCPFNYNFSVDAQPIPKYANDYTNVEWSVEDPDLVDIIPDPLNPLHVDLKMKKQGESTLTITAKNGNGENVRKDEKITVQPEVYDLYLITSSDEEDEECYSVFTGEPISYDKETGVLSFKDYTYDIKRSVTPPKPERVTGFKGWWRWSETDDETPEYISENFVMPADDLFLHAAWEKERVHARFYNDAEVPEEFESLHHSFTYDEEENEIDVETLNSWIEDLGAEFHSADPDKKYFVDWFADKEHTKRFDFDQAITEDTSIYGYWVKEQPIELRWSYQYSKSKGGMTIGKSVTKKLKVPADTKYIDYRDIPLTTGYLSDSNEKMLFTGWALTELPSEGDVIYPDNDALTAINLQEAATEHELAFYAQYEAGETVALDSVAFKPAALSLLTNDTKKYSLSINMTPANATVSRWYWEVEKGEDLIDLDGYGPRAILSAKGKAGDAVVYVSLADLDGNKKSARLSVNITEPDPGQPDPEPKPVVPVPKADEYVISFYVGDDLSKAVTVKKGDVIAASDIPADPKGVFVGWFNGEALWDPSLPVTENLKLSARFAFSSASENKAGTSVMDGQVELVNGEPLWLVKGQSFVLQGDDWTTDKKSVLSIKKNVAKAKKAGTINLSSAEQKTNIAVNIIAPSVEKKKSLIVGEEQQIKFTDLDKEHYSVYWTTTNADVAKVSADGKVYGISKGSATVRAYINGNTYNCKVTVKDVNSKLKVEESSSEVTLVPNQTVTVKFNGFKAAKAKWVPVSANSVSQNTGVLPKGIVYMDNVISISNKGKITAIGVGETTVKSDEAGAQATVKVTVNKPVVKVMHIAKKKKKKLPIYGVKGKILRESSDKNVAEVDKSGKICGKEVGCSVLTYTAGNFEYKAYVYVEDLKLSATDLYGEKCAFSGSGAKFMLNMKAGSAVLLKKEGVSQAVLFKSSDDSVVFVDEAGVITARSKGKKKLTASVNGKKYTINVTVE